LEKIVINSSGSVSEIFVGKNWESVDKMLPAGGVTIITDNNVRDHYGDRFPEAPVISVVPGENSKKLSVIENLAGQLLEAGIDRSGFILGIGGGVVCDLAGFLASVYMRGIRFGFVSSSLLSQVDASTGGKNGVNLGNTKNIIGIIRQPEFVICDPSMLITLPFDEYMSGLAEMIKTAVIGDRLLFERIENSYAEIMSRDITTLTGLVARSVKFKASVVSEDEKEKGLRRILNFGHTYGHAVELQDSIKHGFAVASGMELASYFSCERGLISIDERDRIINLLRRFGFIKEHKIPDDQIAKLILHDKKRAGSDIHFVFTKGIGDVSVEKIPASEVIGFYRRFRDKKVTL
jgi:3-dehydroquinate synthase